MLEQIENIMPTAGLEPTGQPVQAAFHLWTSGGHLLVGVSRILMIAVIQVAH